MRWMVSTVLVSCTRQLPPTAATSPPTPIGEPAPLASSSALSLDRPVAWVRASASEIGCLFEQAGAAVEPAWRCGAPPPPPGDPCDQVGAWNAGPIFPSALRSRLPVPASDVTLGWEHADLRTLELALPAGTDEAAVVADLGLDPLPADVQSLDWYDCDAGRRCLALVGFDHMGAGDVDCPPAPR